MTDPTDAELVLQLRESVVGHPALMDQAASRIKALTAELAQMQEFAGRTLDDVAALRAEVAALREAQEWRGIESAPHGVDVLLWCGDGEPLEVGQASWGWKNDVASNMSWHGRAKRWLPLPPPPAAPEACDE